MHQTRLVHGSIKLTQLYTGRDKTRASTERLGQHMIQNSSGNHDCNSWKEPSLEIQNDRAQQQMDTGILAVYTLVERDHPGDLCVRNPMGQLAAKDHISRFRRKNKGRY